jgi:RNA polymerase-associated protein RTF1
MSDLENELLGLAEDDPHKSKKRRGESKAKSKKAEA